uniref:Uncharacterized protein n=1 Tax=Lutzomyia longipalpis TaxID=7200 RepID=A0A1B0ETE5_LUTLO
MSLFFHLPILIAYNHPNNWVLTHKDVQSGIKWGRSPMGGLLKGTLGTTHSPTDSSLEMEEMEVSPHSSCPLIQ